MPNTLRSVWHHAVYRHALVEHPDTTAAAMFVTPRWFWAWCARPAQYRAFARPHRHHPWIEVDDPYDVYSVMGLKRDSGE
jgi:hypothetical protein